MAVSWSSVKAVVKTIGKTLDKRLPSILVGVGILELTGAIFATAKATPKANEELAEQRDDEIQVAKMLDRPVRKDIWVRTKIIFKNYWRAMVLWASGVGCIILAEVKHLKREAALACLALANRKELEAFKEKILSVDGEKKLAKIKEKLAEGELEKNPSESTQIVYTGRGEHLCYDAWSGRYFYTDIEKVRRAELELNKALLKDGYFSVNDFYDFLGLPQIDLGDLLGWQCDSPDDQVEIHYTSKVTDKGEPCLVIRFDKLPVYQFETFG